MFNLQKAFDLQQETKTLVFVKTSENPLSEKILKTLNMDDETLPKENVTTLYTLGKLKTPKVIILSPDVFTKRKNLSKAAKGIVDEKTDKLLLLETFAAEAIAPLFEELTKAAYRFKRFKTDDKKDDTLIAYHGKEDCAEAVHRGIVIGEAVNHTKELVNTPNNYLNAEKLAEYAEALQEIEGVEAKILGKEACEAMNMGAFLGVNKGSKDEPRLIHLSYKGKPKSIEKTALIGKGIMFDTGGYSLKTGQSMPNMKCDMAGAATVLGVFEAVSRLGFNVNVDCIIAATDNRIGDDAIVPDDILTAANGTTIEVISTDAEGRLTLADALWYAQKEGATRMIDVATLTGHVVMTFGKAFTGGFTNQEAYLDELITVSKTTEEPIWALPVDDQYEELIKSKTADIKNSGGRIAGASVAAVFLRRFVENDLPWIHLDVAGTAFNDKEGGTGVLVRTLTEFFSRQT